MTICSDQAVVFDFLGDSATHHVNTPVRRFDTHGACIFLAGENAYKVKRAVYFPYMDFSTLEKRKSACENEIVANRDNAPGLYIGAVPITRDAAGLHIGGEGDIVEWAVHMRRFNEELTLDRLVENGTLTSDIIDQLALVVSEAHRRAPRRTDASPVVFLRKVILETLQELEEARDLPAMELAFLRNRILSAFAKDEALLVQRALKGKVRRCHGDLHLSNIVLQSGKPILFDAIEFNDDLATTDILYDLAFLIMDLWERGFPDYACRLLNHYLWLSDDESGEIEGLAVLPLFLALRAAIRAKVLIAQAALGLVSFHEQIQSYVQAATLFIKPPPPRLIAIGGMSGAGKTKLAEALSFRIGAAPGSLHLRSDIERKRAFGVVAQSHLAATAYSPTVSESVYRRLAVLAEIGLKSGRTVIVDATFRNPKERHSFELTAVRAKAPFSGLWLEAPRTLRLSRIHDRAGDASDATLKVARTQDTEDVGVVNWPRVDASQPAHSVSGTVLSLLGNIRCSSETS